jgi:hypothetical protein
MISLSGFWFSKMFGKLSVHGKLAVFFLSPAAHRNQADVCSLTCQPDLPGGLASVDLRHAKVQKKTSPDIDPKGGDQVCCRVRLHYLTTSKG